VDHPLQLETKARKPSFSVVALTMLWKSHAWWKWQQALMTTVDPHNFTEWRHTRAGKQVLWEYALVKIFGDNWMRIAVSSQWSATKSKFVDGAYGILGLRSLEERYSDKPQRSKTGIDAGARKRPRELEFEPQIWTQDPETVRAEIVGDPLVITNWINGVWPSKFLPYQRCVARVQQDLHQMILRCRVQPRTQSADFCRHVFRELNQVADSLANRYRNEWHLEPFTHAARFLRGHFDGSRKGDKAAYGWVLYATDDLNEDSEDHWEVVASKSGILPEGASITAAELEGASSLVGFMRAYCCNYDAALANISSFGKMDYDTILKLSLADLV